MKVEIKNFAGETFPIEIFSDSTSHNLKAKIFNDNQINFDFHELKLNGSVVKPDDCILNYFCDDDEPSSYGTQNYEREDLNIPSIECAVNDCKSTKENCPDKTFFPFPNSIDRFQHWLLVCKRDDLLDEPIAVVNKRYAVCADHFLGNQFSDSLKKILKKNVVPSQFHKSNEDFLELLEGDEIIMEEDSEGSITEEEENFNFMHDCSQFESDERSQYSNNSNEIFEHPGQLCRLCANITTEFKYIFDDTGIEEHLAKKINSCLPVAVNISDPLPKQLCSVCELKLKMCYEFSETCMLAEDKLHKLSTSKSFRTLTSEKRFNLKAVAMEQTNSQIISPDQTIDSYHKEENCTLQLNYCCPLCCNGNMSVESKRTKIFSKLNQNDSEEVQVHNDVFDSSGVDQLKLETELGGKNASVCDSRKSYLYSDNDTCDDGPTHKGEHNIDKIENIHSTIKCILCSTGFDSIHECLSHSEFHSSDNHYPCSLCNSEFSSEEKLEAHIEKHKKEMLIPHKVAKMLMCNICGRKFNSEKSMENHVCNVLPRPHKCTECGKFFQTELRLLFHMQLHLGGNPVVCTICGKQFSRENNLFDHVRLVHMGEKAHCCDQCGKTFQLKARLIAHQRVHSGERPFECNICGGKFYDKATLKGHKVTHLNIKPFQCEKCGRCFSRKTLFNQHILTHLSDEKPARIFPCKICSISFSTYTRLVEHKREVHPAMEIIERALRNQISKPFKCDDCGKSFAYRVTLLAHRRNHTGELPFQCEFCQKRFSQKRSLVLHRRTHTGEKPFECSVCGKKFVQSAHLYAHQRLHTGEKPYVCEVCGTSFRLKEVRDAHERKHTGEKPYKCKFCEKTFRTSHSYYQHMWIHEGKKPYCCEYCGKAFRRSNGLKVHMRVHTGERPHICDICGRSFSQKQTMKKHKKLHVKDSKKCTNHDVTD